MLGEAERMLAHQGLGAHGVAGLERAWMMFMWSWIERSTRSSSPIVWPRIMRMWVNRFAASWISTCRCPDSSMMVWWKLIFTSEYSSSLACSVSPSNSVNMRRSPAISASLALCVTSRAAMLSSAAQAVIISITSSAWSCVLRRCARGGGGTERITKLLALELGHGFANGGTGDAETCASWRSIEPDVPSGASDRPRTTR